MSTRPTRCWPACSWAWAVTSLSMAAAAVRPVGARLATVSMDLCEDAAEVALSATDPAAARDAVRTLLLG